VNVDPLDLLVNLLPDLTGEIRNREKQEMNAASARVFVFIPREFASYAGFDLQLFPQFANERLLRRFARFYLPSREFPFQWVTVGAPALSNQDLTVPVDDAG
jgi:hypothetical protein